MEMRLGSTLPPALQEQCKRAYVHRYTGDHKPAWARELRPNGEPYEVQFKDDADWLAHTEFPIAGTCPALWRLTTKGDCYSTPTWPERGA